MTTKKTDTISTKVSKLKALLEKAFEQRFYSISDFKRPVTEEELLKVEASLKTALPDEFRAFCLKIARAAPCPYQPVDKWFPEFRMDNMGRSDTLSLWGSDVNFEPDTQIFRPFPLTKAWEQIVPSNALGNKREITQVDYDVFNRNIAVSSLAKGESPFDGLYELWSETHYCDSFYLGFYLVIRGKAKGQIWVCHTQISDKDKPNMIFRPLASNFLVWYITWLEKNNIC